MHYTFNQVAALWKTCKRPWVKPSTYATYVLLIRCHLEPWFGGKTAIDEACVQAYIQQKLTDGLAPKTVQDTLRVLKMILRHGAKLGAWPPAEFELHFPASAQVKPQVEVLTEREQQRLLNHLQEHFSLRNLGIRICLGSGLRIGELCALRWEDLDVERGVIRVEKTLQRIWLADGAERSNDLLLGPPKTASSRREIPLSRQLLKTLRPLRKVMNAKHFVLSNGPEPLEPRYYRDYYRKLLRQLGIRPLRFHALRHSFATRCIESRCDYKTVS